MPPTGQPAPKKTLPRQTQELRSIHHVLIQAWHPTHSHRHPPPDPHPAPLGRMDHSRKLTRGKPLKVICSRRFAMSGEEAGSSWPTVGMIWTMSTSDASDASTSAIRGGLAAKPPSQYRSPPISTAWLSNGRHADASTISRV